MKKILIALMVFAAALMISVPVTVKADTGWIEIDGAWYYYYTDTSYAHGGRCTIGSKDYFFDSYGRMQTGWCQRPGFSDFWYYAGSDGALVKGWKQISGKWYYFDPYNYYMYYSGRYVIDGKPYYFGGVEHSGGLGAMQTGWIKEEYTYEGNHYVNWYYADRDGVLQTRWQNIKGKWYYFHPDACYMYHNWYYEIDGKTYYFYDSGEMGTGWCKWTDTDGYVIWYYADSSGALQTGWQKINGVWYYLDKSYFSMYRGGRRMVGEVFYYFADSGAMLTGWIKNTYTYEGTTYVEWYYGESSGRLAQGWKKIDGTWYYFQPGNATMYSNIRLRIDGHGYFFLPSGAMKKGGWCRPEGGGNWYYAHEDGTLHEGWLDLNGDTYYLDPTNNFMYVGHKYIDGKWYEFDQDGRLVG